MAHNINRDLCIQCGQKAEAIRIFCTACIRAHRAGTIKNAAELNKLFGHWESCETPSCAQCDLISSTRPWLLVEAEDGV